MIYLEILYNCGVLIAVSVLSGFVGWRWRQGWPAALLQGLLFGCAAVIGMLRPLVVQPGLIFDGRSVMIALAGLFFGPLAALTAAAMAALVRLAQGGIGAATGVLVIMASALLGVMFRRRRLPEAPVALRQLLLLGFAVHAAMLLLMFTLPGGRGWAVLSTIGLPVITIYPLVTVLIGWVLARQDEYRAREGELQTYFEAGLDLFCIIDRQGCFRRLNRQWESTLGYAAAALAGRQFMAYVHPDDVALTAAALARCAQTTQNYTNRYRHADGSYRWLEWRVCAHDPMLYAAARDITARKHNEEQLRQFRFMVEYAGQEIYLARPDGTLAYVNRTAAAGLGYTQAELQRLGVAGIDDGFGPVFAQHFAELKRGDLPPFVTWHRAKDGRLIPKEMKSFYLQIGDDEFICGFAQDITARRQAEEELRIKNLAFAASIAGSSVADQDGIIRYVNEAFLAMWGFVDHAAATGRPQAEFFSEPREAQAILTALIENGRWQGVFTAKRRDGTTFLAETRATAIRDSQGVLVGYQAACLDVTDRVRMEQALRASEERLRRLMENAPDMIFHMTLPEGRYEYVSRAAHEITGYRPEDFYRNPQMIADMIPAEWQGYFAAEWKKFLAGEVTPSYEFQFRTAAGELRWANQRNVPIRDGHGVLLGIEGIVTDVTERKQAETARLRRQEELERFERLAVGREKKMIELKQTIAALRQQLAARGGGET